MLSLAAEKDANEARRRCSMERECEHVTDTRSVECESCDVRAKPKNSFPSDTRSTKTSLPNGTHSTDISPPSDTFSTRLQYTSVDRTSLASLRQFNSLLFPITYPESFYRSIIHTIGVSAFLVYWNETCIGSYSTRLESQTRWLSLVAGHVSDNFAPETLSDESPHMCYIMTLGVLAAHRRSGHGNRILTRIIEDVRDAGLRCIGLHVHVENRAALSFYERRGFRSVGIVNDYYRKIVPSSAYILELQL